VILTTLDLAPSLGAAEAPPRDLCGSCTKCIDACPTHALVEPYLMDSRLCIAYLTIEYRGSIPEQLRESMGRHVFGCDICQDVCPWNRRAPATKIEVFQPRQIFAGVVKSSGSSGGTVEVTPGSFASPAGTGRLRMASESLLLPRLEWLASLTEEEFRAYFRGSPVKRTKWRGLIRNACIALGNSAWASGTTLDGSGGTQNQQDTAGRERIRGLLKRLSDSAEPVISDSAKWALSRIE
jgi:epoxyqueuosine reductase